MLKLYLPIDTFYYPHAFLKKRRGYCTRLRLSVRVSVCLLCYLLLNRWTKFNQIWCVSYSHEWGVQKQIFFGPAPWGPGEGSKGQISFNFNCKVNFKDFYTPANFVCRGYTVFTLSVRVSVRPCIRPSVRNALFP